MMDLHFENDPILKQVTPVYDFENPPEFLTQEKELDLSGFVDTLFVTMKINRGVGLAASQIGHSLRIFVMKVGDEEIVCINPEIVQKSNDVTVDQEGCLSFPDLALTVTRPREINVLYYGVEGFALRRWFTGELARCFCHELDHLNGITFDTLVPKLSLKIAKEKRRKFLKQQKRKK